MKNIIGIVSIAVLALSGCSDSQAQDSVSIDAGNPSSSNVMIMEGYEAVVIPENNNTSNQGTQSETENDQQPSITNDNNQNNNSIYEESITDTQTPNSEEIDIEESETSNN